MHAVVAYVPQRQQQQQEAVAGDMSAGAAAVAPDVQWSAKVSMPVGAGTVYVAMDEESGNAFGGSAMVSGIDVSSSTASWKLWSQTLSLTVSNTLGVS